MTHTLTHLKDQLKEFIPVGQGGLSTLKVALLFTLFAWLQFLFLFTNMGPLTAPDPEMVSAGSYALATGQSFAPTCPDGEDEVMLDNFTLAGHPQKINLPENLVYKQDIYNKNGVTSYFTSIILQISNGKMLHSGDVVPTDSLLESQMSYLGDPDASTSTTNTYTRANQYNPICYIPTALGMKVAMIAGSNSWGLLQSARIFNFLFYFALSILAICLIPRGKGLMAVLAALPPSIFCASALTVDALLIGVCMVSVAYCIKILDKNAPLQKTQVVLIAFMTLLIMLLKAPYAALALIYLALPSKIWPAKQKAIAAGATLACFAVLYGLWAANFQMTYVHPSVNYQEESAYVMTNLPYVLFICFINCIYTLCIVAPVYCMYIIFPIAIALVVTCSRSSHGTPKSILITALLCVLIVITVIFVFEALTWCNVSAGVTNLYGFQERYALPLLPLFAFLAKNPVISKCNTHALQNLSQVVTETN